MTEELKKALESAKTEEEKKAITEKFKNELRKLSDEELEGVAGGVLGFGTHVEDGGARSPEGLSS